MTWQEATVAVGAFVTVAGFVWGAIRTRRTDALTERSGVLTEARAGTIQRWEELESINAILRADNAALREEARHDQARMDRLEEKVDALQMELARMKRKFGENGP